jgi:hypothetical protein
VKVLQILTQELAPSLDLIATVKHLYETKLKDVSILIPLLSSLTKDEVLPIFPPLLNLPPEKFQLALAHILQGSAHTGPALTPAEVLIAIHDIVPEKDGPPLKKVFPTFLSGLKVLLKGLVFCTHLLKISRDTRPTLLCIFSYWHAFFTIPISFRCISSA